MRGLTALACAASLLVSPYAVAGPPSAGTACEQGVPALTALVGVRPGAPVAAVARAVGATPGARLAPLDAYQLRFPTAAATTAGIAALRRHPAVRYAEPNALMYAHETPSDPLFADQWALEKVGARTAWNVEVGESSPVDVAVLDTGVDLAHPDLTARLRPGFNAMNPSAEPQDDHTHGTHVAGIVAAATNNGVGVAGMSWGARVVPVKVLGANGSGDLCDIVTALLYAAASDVKVVNLSLGAGMPCPAVMQAALAVVHASGALAVASAGNGGAGFNTTNAPANCDHSLGVGATDQFDGLASFSNYGSYVDVAAPGVGVLSTVIDPKTGAHKYAALSGTSMAAPMVAGLAALLFARHPDWTPDQVAAHITKTSRDLGPRGPDVRFGAGRIDAAKALRP